jgi:hypothetical protein
VEAGAVPAAAAAEVGIVGQEVVVAVAVQPLLLHVVGAWVLVEEVGEVRSHPRCWLPLQSHVKQVTSLS